MGVRFGVVRETHRRGVPLKLHSGEADRDGPDQSEFCQRPAVIEVRAALASCTNCGEPVAVVALSGNPRYPRTRFLGSLQTLARDQIEIFRTVRAVNDDALVSVYDGTRTRLVLVFLELRRARRAPIAVKPHKLDGPALSPGGKLKGNLDATRVEVAVLLRIVAVDLGVTRRGSAEIQRPEAGVEDVTGPVPEAAGAEGHPAAPIPGHPERAIRTELRRPEPDVVVEFAGHLVLLREFRDLVDLTVDFTKRIAEGVDLRDVADRSVLYPLDEVSNGVPGVALVAKLRDDLVLVRRLHHRAHLGDRVGERLLTVDVLPAPHRIKSDDGVSVVGHADGYRVDALVQIVEHLAEVLVALGGRKLLEGIADLPVIDIAEADDVLPGTGIHAPPPPPTDTHAGDVDLVARRRSPGSTEKVRGSDLDKSHPGRGSLEEEATTHCARRRCGFFRFLHRDIRSDNMVISPSPYRNQGDGAPQLTL